jgi:hypothetical protein
MGQIKAPIAGKAQSNRCSQSIRFAHGLGPAHGASFSKAIGKIGNAELAHFNKQMLIHELIRGSLEIACCFRPVASLDKLTVRNIKQIGNLPY